MSRRSNPVVSIITIVLNGEREIRTTVQSVLQQSYPAIEYIVIDGESKDNTVEIIKEYGDKISIFLSEKDRGISDAFNKGLARASGEIIGILNAGDWYTPDTVSTIVTIFEKKKVDIVCGATQFWRGEQQEYRCESEPLYLEKEMSITHPSCFVKKELYENYGFFDISYRYAMDYELLLRMKTRGAVFFSAKDIIANMQHDGVSDQNWRKALLETHRARKELLRPSFYTSLFYCSFLIAKRGIRVLLEILGMERLLQLYRERIALVKKTRI